MDIKELAKKVVDGGNAEELTKELTPEVKAQVWGEVTNQRKAQADAELAIITARKKERERVETDVTSVTTAAVNTVKSQMRGEQIDMAFSLAESTLQSKGITLTPEIKAKLKEEFPKFDSGKFDAKLIGSDILRTYAALNAESLIDSFQSAASGARSAADFNAGAASPGSTGSGTQPDAPMSPYVRAAMQASAKFGVPLTRQQAERAEQAGTDWKVLTPKPKK